MKKQDPAVAMGVLLLLCAANAAYQGPESAPGQQMLARHVGVFVVSPRPYTLRTARAAKNPARTGRRRDEGEACFALPEDLQGAQRLVAGTTRCVPLW